MDDPDRPPCATGDHAPLHHPGVGPEERGRPHSQTGGYHQNKPTLPGESGGWSSPADHRGSVGAPAIPCNHIPGQYRLRRSSCPPPLRQALEDPLPAIEREGGTIQRISIRQEGQLQRQDGHIPRSQPQHRRGGRAHGYSHGAICAHDCQLQEHGDSEDICAPRSGPAPGSQLRHPSRPEEGQGHRQEL